MSAKRAYIIEDDAIARLTLQKMLQQQGYTTAAFSSTGEAALDWLQTNVCDLLLIDISLAGELDGWETACRLRDFSQAPVIFCSSSPPPNSVLQNNYPFLPKPYAPQMLQELLREIQNRERLLGKVLRTFEFKNILEWLYDLNGVAFAVNDQAGNFVHVNQTYLKLLKYENKNVLIGQSFLSMVPEDFRGQAWEIYEGTYSGRLKEIPSDWTVYNALGEPTTIWVNASFIEENRGEKYKITTFLPKTSQGIGPYVHEQRFLEEGYALVEAYYQQLSTLLFEHTDYLNQRPELYAYLLRILFKLRTLSLARAQSPRLERYYDLSQYLQDLVLQLKPLLAKQGTRLEANLFTGIYVPFSLLFASGLMVAEMLLNACRHAFSLEQKEAQTACIKFSLERNFDTETYLLEVADNGRGLPSGFSPENSASPGMQLLLNLSRQSGLVLSWSNGLEAGACFGLSGSLWRV